MRYRRASIDDATAIAGLHAESWRLAYRGALRDEFLDGDIFADRATQWAGRLSAPPANQLVLLAEDDDGPVGFACAYGREDERWGTLLDNLHVRRARQRHGTGARLLAGVAAWTLAYHPDAGLYLWVLEQNRDAQQFYRKLGAADRGGDVWTPPGGGSVPTRRYAWPSGAPLRVLASKGPPPVEAGTRRTPS